MITLCKACGTSYEITDSPPAQCTICQDATVGDITQRLSTVKFKKLYGAFEGKDITANADEIVRRSGEKYLRCLR